MSKKSFILPIVAAMILAGCTLGKTTKKKKKSSSSSEISQSSGASSSQSGSSSAQGSSSASSAQGSSSAQSSSSGSASSVTPPTGSWSSADLSVMQQYLGLTIPYFGGTWDAWAYDEDYGCVYSASSNVSVATCKSILTNDGWEELGADQSGDMWYGKGGVELCPYTYDGETQVEAYPEGGGEDDPEPTGDVATVITDIVKAVFDQSTATFNEDYFYDSTNQVYWTGVNFSSATESDLQTICQQVLEMLPTNLKVTKEIAPYTDTSGSGYEAYLSNASGTVEINVYSGMSQGEDGTTAPAVFILVYEDEGGTGPIDPTGDTVTISKEDIASNVPSGSTYPTASYSFTTDGVTFNANAGVGVAASQNSGGNYFYEQDLIQVRTHKDATEAKPGGEITNTTAISANTVTIRWFATYATEASEYHPVVKVGDSAGAVSTNVPCNEGTSLTGVDTGSTQNMNGTDRKVYSYTTTYTITGHSYIMIASPNSAIYIKDIVIS